MSWFLKLSTRKPFFALQTPASLFHQVRFFPHSEQGQLLHLSNTTKPTFIHPSSIIHPNAVIGEGVSVGPFCSVSSSAKLGDGCQLYPGSHVFGSTELGDNCVLMSGAVVGDDYPGYTIIGNNNTIGLETSVSWKLGTIMISESILQFTDLRSQLIKLVTFNWDFDCWDSEGVGSYSKHYTTNKNLRVG